MAFGNSNTVEIRVKAEDDTKSGFSSVDKSASSIGDKLKKIGAAAAIGFAAAGVAAVKFGAEAISEASDLNETINKTRVIFGKNADDILKWSQKSATAFGLSRNEALGYASDLGNMLDQLGFNGQATEKLSKSTVKFAADLGSFHNLETGDVLDRISAAMRGEYDSLQALIPNINAARVEQVAMAQTGKESADALTAQEKAAATLSIIHKDGAKAAGDFAKTSGSLANQQKILAAQTDNFQAKIGKLLLPLMVKLMGFITGTVMPGLFRFSKWFQQEAIPWIKQFVATTREKLQPLIQWVKDHWPEIQETIQRVLARVVEIVVTVTARIRQFWAKWGDDILRIARVIFDYIKNTIKNQLKIIQGVINVITGLIKGDWGQVWKGIQQIFGGVMGQIKNIAITALKLLREIFRSAWDAIKDISKRAFGALVDLGRAGLGKLKDAFLFYIGIYKRIFLGYLDFWRSVWGRVWDAAKAIWDKIRATFDKGVDGIKRIWDRLRRVAVAPVNFVINQVINKGIIRAINALPFIDDIDALPLIGHRGGGYTGNGDKNKIAGLVHGREFVINAESTAKIQRTNPGFLEHLNQMGIPGHRAGGFVNPMARVYRDGEPITAIHAAQLYLAGKLMGVKQHVIQGSWQAPSSYSGTSHTGPGVADTSPGSFRAQWAQRRAGIAAWARNIPGAHYAGSGAHVHGVSMFSAPGNLQLAAYRAGGDGLGGRDYGPRPGLMPGLFDKLKRFKGLVMSGIGLIDMPDVSDFVGDVQPGFLDALKNVWDKIHSMSGTGWPGMLKDMAGGLVGKAKDWGIDAIKDAAKAAIEKPTEWWKDWASGFVPKFGMDSGTGTLSPGWNGVWNGTGRPEPIRRTDAPVVLEIHSGGSQLDDLLVEVLRKAIRVKGGNVQAVLGR